MAESHPRADRIGPVARVAYLGMALLCIHLGVTLELDHPMQLTMDVLAPIPPLLLAAAPSYRSGVAKLALALALLCWAAMIAAPSVFPSPLRY